jgi:peptidoglycan L-alanyl-D-glutamate endopeptidase CwlK
MKAAAKELGVSIVWGGDWRTFKDGPHFELDRKFYP